MIIAPAADSYELTRESNDCHNPGGRDGGQFCSGGGLHAGDLPDNPSDYFNHDPLATMIPVAKMRTIRARPEGIAHAEQLMQAAREGKHAKRDTLTLTKHEDGTYSVRDGNSTVAIAKKHGWKEMPGHVLVQVDTHRGRTPGFLGRNRSRKLGESNDCHNPGGPGGGRFCSTGGGRTVNQRAQKRPRPIKVSDVGEAIELILAGKVVELPDVARVNTVLTKLAAMANDAKARGEKAPKYDLCKVSVPGTNLFCGSKLRSKKYPNGVPRINMPQLSGDAVSGSPADQLPKSKSGAVDGADAFVAHLKSVGIRTEKQTIPASRLKASQAELVGRKVASMMIREGYDPARKSIFVSRDNYVVDGHHRWAAIVGRDAADGVLGSLKMNIIRIDAPISEILHRANRWTKRFGIASKGVEDDD